MASTHNFAANATPASGRQSSQMDGSRSLTVIYMLLLVQAARNILRATTGPVAR